VGLSEITHKIQYEDIPAEVDISFARFEKFVPEKYQSVHERKFCGVVQGK
jgi:Zn-finger domain-containing protein